MLNSQLRYNFCRRSEVWDSYNISPFFWFSLYNQGNIPLLVPALVSKLSKRHSLERQKNNLLACFVCTQVILVIRSTFGCRTKQESALVRASVAIWRLSFVKSFNLHGGHSNRFPAMRFCLGYTPSKDFVHGIYFNYSNYTGREQVE